MSITPLESEEVPDYRMSVDAPQSLAAGDRPSIRRVRYRQSAAKEMMEAQGITTGPQIPEGITVETPADEAACGERARLAAASGEGGPLRGSADGIYNGLRAAIEGANVLVFQHPLETKGVRGLALAAPRPCAILVNSRETAPARSFTLLHGYGHILLGRSGVCDEHGAARRESDKERVEAWCNRFAASLLMPRAAFAAEIGRLEDRLDGPLGVVEHLAKKFKTSKYAAAVRAADQPGGNARPGYGGALDKIAGRHSRRQKPGKGGGRKGGAAPAPASILASRLGKKFIRLVLSSHERGVITSRDLGDYLETSLDRIDILREKVSPGDRHGVHG